MKTSNHWNELATRLASEAELDYFHAYRAARVPPTARPSFETFGTMIEHAIQLAKALDAEDYDAAVKHLARGCTYELRGRVIEGAAAVIASYRAAGESARARVDTVLYQSSTWPVGTDGARIEYTDILTLGGDTHSYRCAQEVSLDKDGLVAHIRHIDLEGEGEALLQFEAQRAERWRQPLTPCAVET